MQYNQCPAWKLTMGVLEGGGAVKLNKLIKFIGAYVWVS
jgi:hypothetical protein